MWAKYKHTPAFTIVELLIVIVVIGILAALVISTFATAQNRAHDSAVEADFNAMKKKLGVFFVEYERYPSSVAELEGLKIDVANGSYAVDTQAGANLGYCVKGGSTDYLIAAMSKSGKRIVLTSSGVSADASGAVWDGTSGNVGGVCSYYGFAAPIMHGYHRPSTPQWRPWVGGA